MTDTDQKLARLTKADLISQISCLKNELAEANSANNGLRNELAIRDNDVEQLKQSVEGYTGQVARQLTQLKELASLRQEAEGRRYCMEGLKDLTPALHGLLAYAQSCAQAKKEYYPQWEVFSMGLKDFIAQFEDDIEYEPISMEPGELTYVDKPAYQSTPGYAERQEERYTPTMGMQFGK